LKVLPTEQRVDAEQDLIMKTETKVKTEQGQVSPAKWECKLCAKLFKTEPELTQHQRKDKGHLSRIKLVGSKGNDIKPSVDKLDKRPEPRHSNNNNVSGVNYHNLLKRKETKHVPELKPVVPYDNQESDSELTKDYSSPPLSPVSAPGSPSIIPEDFPDSPFLFHASAETPQSPSYFSPSKDLKVKSSQPNYESLVLNASKGKANKSLKTEIYREDPADALPDSPRASSDRPPSPAPSATGTVRYDDPEFKARPSEPEAPVAAEDDEDDDLAVVEVVKARPSTDAVPFKKERSPTPPRVSPNDADDPDDILVLDDESDVDEDEIEVEQVYSANQRSTVEPPKLCPYCNIALLDERHEVRHSRDPLHLQKRQAALKQGMYDTEEFYKVEEEEDYETDADYWNDLTKQLGADCGSKTFTCVLCEVQCTGPQAFENHLTGNAHAKKKKDNDFRTEGYKHVTQNLEDAFERENAIKLKEGDRGIRMSRDPVEIFVGLDFVEEFVDLKDPLHMLKYACHLCNRRNFHPDNLGKHLVSNEHRKKYIREKLPHMVPEVKELKMEQNPQEAWRDKAV